MENLKIWCTYHDDKQIEAHKLQNTDIIRLYNVNDNNIEGQHINYLNKFYSEIVTLYYVWKNQIQSDLVGFCHYRRHFTHYNLDLIKDGTCQGLMAYKVEGILPHYKHFHNYLDLYTFIDICNDFYGYSNRYTDYLINGKVMVACCCFTMTWNDFNKLCDWLFPILFEWDKRYNLNMDAIRYRIKAENDFRYEDVDYQQRAISFLAERLISCYIVTNMKWSL